MSCEVIFDISVDGYQTWWVVAFGTLASVNVIALMAWIVRAEFRHAKRPPLQTIVVPAVLSALPVLWTATVFTISYCAYLELSAAARSATASVTEGRIVGFVPAAQPWGWETFRIGETSFSYSTYVVLMPGFRGGGGGRIRVGALSRVVHVGSDIARLQVCWND